ncbi:hypothetical protein AAVH_41974, partial [Aphelenchoides avenae]
MSKRSQDSQASAFEDLVKRQKADGSDAEILHEQVTPAMSERPHGSQAPAAEDPAECLKAVANDAEPLREQ